MEKEQIYSIEGEVAEANEAEEKEEFVTVSDKENEEYYSLPGGSRSILKSVLALLCSIASVGVCFLWYVGIAFAAAGVVFSLLFKKQFGYFNRAAVVGLILSIFGLVFSAAFFAAGLIGII